MGFDTLPSGERFAFWDDATDYRRVYHVDQGHPRASDENAGTADAPLRTINAAARLLQPGEKVVVHAGVYRECVRPARGGAGEDRMIAYEAAAEGGPVIVRGSEVWEPAVRPSSGYGTATSRSGATIWMADLPEHFFGAYNPFLLRNAYEYLPIYGNLGAQEFLRRALLRRGTVFVDGTPLKQVYYCRELRTQDGAFWVEEPGLRIHFRLPGDADPAGHVFEVTAREQAFAPAEFGLGYLRVSGLAFEHVADGLPVPQRAAVSTMRGHHWIIENNRVEWANACGMDIGAQTWEAAIPDPTGCHVIRANTIRRCGICGLAGALGVHHTLIDGNTIEHIGALDLERMWECGGIKFHLAEHTLIRGNTFRHIRNAGGIWLDCSNVDCRIVDNVFADIESLTGGVYMEMNYDANLIDHNVFWDIRDPAGGAGTPPSGGCAIRADCNENLAVAHNFFGQIQGYAVLHSLVQSDRRHAGRTGLCRGSAALNNVFFQCPHRIHLGRCEENRSDGNLFDAADDNCSFNIANPQPPAFQNLAGWQRYFGLDLHSAQARIEAELDVETRNLTWRADKPLPDPQPLDLLPADGHTTTVGPNRFPPGSPSTP